MEITGARQSLSATCSATGQNLTLGAGPEGPLIPHSGGTRTGLLALVILLISTATVWSEETPRYVPDVGVRLTYKRITVVPDGRRSGSIFINTVLRSDQLVAVLKPSRIALLSDESEITSRCRAAENCDKIVRSLEKEDNMLRIPVPKQLIDSDAELRYRYFFLTDLIWRGLKVSADDSGNIKIDGKGFVLDDDDSPLSSLKLECDWSGLTTFFPLGRSPKINFKCNVATTMRTNDRGMFSPPFTTTRLSSGVKDYEITYEGRSSTSQLSKASLSG
jgi:hypothetical protein